jgi:signal transduction histidine kinase
MDALALRDHAADLLLATVRDMESVQSPSQRADKTNGYLDGSQRTMRLNGAPEEHAIGRLGDGFDLMQLVSEYRALRASVVELWHASSPRPHEEDVSDLSLFNASIDESLATAVKCYTQRIDESRDMFLAILSHDLRNPLNSIATSAQLMPRVSELDQKSISFTRQISTSAKVMTKMIGDLLDYTRTRLGAGMPIAREAMDLGVLAQEVVEEFRSSHLASPIAIATTGDLKGEWDPARLRQVLSNLVGNAIQHGDRITAIEVTLHGDETQASVAIRNGGVPIPAGELAKIFDPLVRGASSESPRQNRPGSIGLGLYIARELVVAHGGSIAVRSSAAEGTVFTFHLPHIARLSSDLHPGASLVGA